jgi:propionyl-CoA carboxylase alpha chain
VYRGQELVIVESMKMESGVASPCDGEVTEILVEKGQPVDTGNVLIRFRP